MAGHEQVSRTRVLKTAVIGIDLMNAYNRGKTDPSVMAMLGHSISDGFEFCMERDGITYVITVRRNLSD